MGFLLRFFVVGDLEQPPGRLQLEHVIVGQGRHSFNIGQENVLCRWFRRR